MVLTCVPFQAGHAEQILRLMDMAGQETLAGITGHRYSTLEDLLEEERDSELGDDCVLIALRDGYPVGFSCQDILYDDFYSGEERSLFAT